MWAKSCSCWNYTTRAVLRCQVQLHARMRRGVKGAWACAGPQPELSFVPAWGHQCPWQTSQQWGQRVSRTCRAISGARGSAGYVGPRWPHCWALSAGPAMLCQDVCPGCSRMTTLPLQLCMGSPGCQRGSKCCGGRSHSRGKPTAQVATW